MLATTSQRLGFSASPRHSVLCANIGGGASTSRSFQLLIPQLVPMARAQRPTRDLLHLFICIQCEFPTAATTHRSGVQLLRHITPSKSFDEVGQSPDRLISLPSVYFDFQCNIVAN